MTGSVAAIRCGTEGYGYRHILKTRLKKEAMKLAAQEDRLVDLAADGSLPTGKLRERLREFGVRKHQVQSQLERTDDHLRARTESVLVYLDQPRCSRWLRTCATL